MVTHHNEIRNGLGSKFRTICGWKNCSVRTRPDMYDNNPITFLNLRRLPARLDYSGVAILLNFDVRAVKTLVGLGLLKPLGNAKPQNQKHFATKTILRLAEDEKWLHDATKALFKQWRGKYTDSELQPSEIRTMDADTR